MDAGDEVGDGREAAATQGLAGDDREEGFDQVQPGARGRGEVRAEAKSSDEHLTWTDVTVRGLWHDALRRRLVGGRTAGSL